MSTALAGNWTQDDFLLWVERQEKGHEFDGSQPVPMNGGTLNHNLVCWNIGGALRDALRGTKWQLLGQGAAIATTGARIRYPDAVVAPGPLPGRSRLLPNPVAVFEVVSPSSCRLDRVVKVREYAGVPSILCYVIADSEADVLQVLTRPDGATPWTSTPLAAEDALGLSLPGTASLSIPVTAFYAGIEFEQEQDDAPGQATTTP